MTKAQVTVGIAVLAGFGVLSGMIFWIPDEVPDYLEKILNMIVGAWIVLSTQVVNYFFGSSKGSSDKTALLSEQVRYIRVGQAPGGGSPPGTVKPIEKPDLTGEKP